MVIKLYAKISTMESSLCSEALFLVVECSVVHCSSLFVVYFHVLSIWLGSFGSDRAYQQFRVQTTCINLHIAPV